MKKLILLLSISLLGTGFLSAEREFRPVLDGEMIRWSFIIQCNSGGGISPRSFGQSSIEIIAFGDTLINNLVYKRLFIDQSFYPGHVDENDTNWQNHTPRLYHRWKHIFIRESDDASRLYLYNSFYDKEFLLSDMSLQEGDVGVRYVFFEDGLKHIVLDRSGGHHWFTFIEGVGPNEWQIWWFPGHDSALNCFQNQSIFYRNIRNFHFPDFPCGGYQRYVSVNDIFANEYFVFVSAGKIELVFTSSVNVDIAIYSIQGNLQYTREDVSGQKFIVPTSSFQSGVYVLRIFDRESQGAVSKKIIIN